MTNNEERNAEIRNPNTERGSPLLRWRRCCANGIDWPGALLTLRANIEPWTPQRAVPTTTMEAPEVPLEQTQEHIHEHAHHSKVSWILGVALSSALLAAFAAVASLMAGGHANEAMMEQMQASDQWAYYQAKGIKAGVLATKVDLLKAIGKPVPAADEEKMAEYKKEQKEIQELADHKEKESKGHLHVHEVLARSVTMFQVAIAVSAIAVLTKRRRFWYVGMAFGVVGVAFFVQGLLTH